MQNANSNPTIATLANKNSHYIHKTLAQNLNRDMTYEGVKKKAHISRKNLISLI